MTTSNFSELGIDNELLSGKPLDAGGRLWCKVLNGFWDLSMEPGDAGMRDYIAYHQYFVIELDAWRSNSDGLSLHTYKDLIDLVKHLKENAAAPRTSREVLDFFSSTRTTSAALISQASLSQHRSVETLRHENSIFLAVRLWLMVNVGSPNLQRIFPGKTEINWSQNDSLRGLLAAQFLSFQQLTPLLNDFQYPRDLNVYELERIAGLRIVWTDHLADHLRLDLDLRTITLYHHVSVLKCQKDAKKQL